MATFRFELYGFSGAAVGSHQAGAGQAVLPPPGSDIFSPYFLSKTRGISQGITTEAKESSSLQDTALKEDLLKSHGPFSTSISHRSFLKSLPRNPAVAKDSRFEEVSIQSIDMVSNTSSVTEKAESKHAPTKPVTTEMGYGVVRLYRDAEETIGLYDDSLEGSLPGGSDMTASAITVPASGKKGWKEEDCRTLCILAVPSYLTPSDFLGWVGDQTREEVSHIRMIRTGRINRYMVLMKFRQAKKAREWRKEWNGKTFHSTEPETCQVVFVKSVQFEAPDADPSQFPANTNDPFTPVPMTVSSAVASATTSSSITAKPLAPPTPALVELPTCPVCLERMDETTGLLTIICQHVFHCTCLQKWKGSGCPVCRFTQGSVTGRVKGEYGSCEEDCEEQICSICASDANLWICLICGNVGCGRYDEAHAFQHYQETSHCYAMDLESQRVWDYAGDGYVHRMIQSSADGKLMDLPSVLGDRKEKNTDKDDDDDDYIPRQKVKNIGEEYTHLLTSQLESQRLYFEEKFTQAADKASQASSAAEKAAERADRAVKALSELEISNSKLTKETVPGLEREVERLGQRATKATEMARTMEKQWREEKSINESLMERVKFLDGELDKTKAERDDVAEQNRDLTFFITGSQRLQEAGVGEDVVEGKVEVGEAPSNNKKKGKNRKK